MSEEAKSAEFDCNQTSVTELMAAAAQQDPYKNEILTAEHSELSLGVPQPPSKKPTECLSNKSLERCDNKD